MVFLESLMILRTLPLFPETNQGNRLLEHTLQIASCLLGDTVQREGTWRLLYQNTCAFGSVDHFLTCFNTWQWCFFLALCTSAQWLNQLPCCPFGALGLVHLRGEGRIVIRNNFTKGSVVFI